jgi:hypothetical protein
MIPDDIAKIDREFLRNQELARINERLQVWVVFISLSSGFGYIAAQNSKLVYLGVLYLLLVAYLAMHVRHGQNVLREIRKYLYQQEQDAKYAGYEHFIRSNIRTFHGGYRHALRGAFVTMQVLASGVVIAHMISVYVFVPFIVIVCTASMAVIAFTWKQLSSRKRTK